MRSAKGFFKDLLVIFLLGAGGLLGAYFLLAHAGMARSWWIVALFFFLIGYIFELATEKLWEYPDLFFRLPFTKKDLSITLPIAWAGLMSFSFALTVFLEHTVFVWNVLPVWRIPSVIYFVFPAAVVAFVIGNAAEAFFHAIDYFRYTDDFFKRYGRIMLPWGVPVLVAVGYAWFFGILLFSIMHLILAAVNG